MPFSFARHRRAKGESPHNGSPLSGSHPAIRFFPKPAIRLDYRLSPGNSLFIQ
jgi:hypothetical protein